MKLRNQIDDILAWIAANQTKLATNEIIFNILEGDVLSEVAKAIDKQLSGESQKISKQRIPPVNILRKVVDKLTSLYSKEPQREVNAQDQELVDFYVDDLSVNEVGETVNESFNAYKYGVAEIYNNRKTRKIAVRVLPSSLFLPYGNDKQRPDLMTAMIKFMGTATVEKSTGVAAYHPNKATDKKNIIDTNIYHVFSDDEFLAITSEGKIFMPDMEENPEGVNPYGVIPFSYVKRSKFLLLPKTDTDTIAMSVLIPLLMTEINFASMFLSNPIFYGVDIEVGDLEISPLSFWNVSSNQEGDKQGSLNVLQPNLDIASQSDWIKEQLAIWLETKNIKASHLIDGDSASIASGIALIIREMDTTEDRNKQAKYFVNWEADFWMRLSKIHNVLSDSNQLAEKKRFSNNLSVKTSFGVQIPIEDRTVIEARTLVKYEKGLISKETALLELYPDWSEERLTDELENSSMSLEGIIPGESGGDIDEPSLEEGASDENLEDENKRLNGAQVTAIVGLAEKVASGLLTESAAVNIVVNAFGFTPEDARKMLAGSSSAPAKAASGEV